MCSIFQYVIKWWLRALQLSGSREHYTKVIMVAYEYTYQDHEYIIRTMNTKHERAVWAFLLQAGHKIAVSCPKTFLVSFLGK